jgi:RNA polymerase sigma factor (sigma-70 family)
MTASLSVVTRYVRRLSRQDTRGLTDRQLLERFTLHQEEDAFAELVRRHGPMVLAVCRRVLRHQHDAEDGFQAAFLVLARKAGSIRQRDSVAGWLYQVAHRLALRARAAGERRRRQTAALGDTAAAGAEPPDGSLRSCLDRELGRLPEQYRSAIVLCYLEGRTQTEAARLLRTTADAVNSRLKRARDLLRQRLARCGLALSGVALAQALAAGAATAALPAALVRLTARTALDFAAGRAACGASALAAALARGALHGMFTPRLKLLSVLALFVALLATGPLFLPPLALGDDPPAAAAQNADQPPKPGEKPVPQPVGKAKAPKSCIILWMSGGPSQIDTFDPKPKDPNGGLFGAIDTNAKGIQISQTLPRLARQANHLAIIRSLTHREGDHGRGTFLMRTGYTVDGMSGFPALGCVLGKELGASRPDVPRYVNIAPWAPGGRMEQDPGCLGLEYAPLNIAVRGLGVAPGPDDLRLPHAEAFEALARGKGQQLRKAVEKAFDLTQEKAQVRDAYGRGLFGQGCLLARRLVEAGVPVVELTLPGWDTHANAQQALQKLCAELDAAFSSLLKDLEERKRLDTTLVVWMGEFGRTPRINAQGGRDHWPMGFSVVLAGGGIKGGQVIGKTSADAVKVQERPVTPAELHATIYQALGVDATKTYKTNTGRQVPLVERGTKAVKEALR